MAEIYPEMVQKGDKKRIGRPPVHFQDDQLDSLGEELKKWMKDNFDNNSVVHMADWYETVKDMTPKEWDGLTKRVGFRDYYEQFRTWMGRKMMRNKDLNSSFGNRYLGIYMSEVHEYEEGKADRQAERLKKNNEQKEQNITVNIVDYAKIKPQEIAQE